MDWQDSWTARPGGVPGQVEAELPGQLDWQDAGQHGHMNCQDSGTIPVHRKCLEERTASTYGLAETCGL